MTDWRKQIKRSWWLWALGKFWPWLLLVVMVVSIKIGLVVGPSMEPTLHTGDVLILAKWLEPQEGDIVISRVPWREEYFCKRVSDIQDGRYYLLGDNINNSLDSRCFGPVERGDIIGISIFEIKIGGLFVCVKSSILW